jgi:hypothetical protein
MENNKSKNAKETGKLETANNLDCGFDGESRNRKAKDCW